MKKIVNTIFIIFILSSLLSCIQVPKTIEYDSRIPYTEINGYKFHTELVGDENLSPVIVVHGGPGGDFAYMKSLGALADNYRVIFYDQRGSGLSPRVTKEQLTLESNLDDLNAMVDHFSNGKKIRLIGHSWGAMLVVGYLSQYPDKISQAVIVEPGILHPGSAKVFVEKIKESQSISDLFALIGYITLYPFVEKLDGHEGYDYVMTKILNRGKAGPPYQCDDQGMSESAFIRGGYDAFDNMLKPLMDKPELFSYDLTDGVTQYQGGLVMISSECSVFGYEFQESYHLPKLPVQTIHIKAENRGHNMITLNPQWSIKTIGEFFDNKL